MIRRPLATADRRALTLGAVFVLPVLAWTLAVRPYVRALAETTERLHDARMLLAREQRLITEAPDYPLRRRRASAALGSTWTRLVRGPDTLSVAAALASHVTDEASGAGMLVEQVETHSPDSLRAASLDRVRLGAATVDLRARGDLDGVLTFLDALETGETLVRVDRLRIERAPMGTDAAGQETLALTVTVSGIARVLSHPVSAPPRAAYAGRPRATATSGGALDTLDSRRAP